MWWIARRASARAASRPQYRRAGGRLLLRAEVVAFTSRRDERDDFVQSAAGADLSVGNWVLAVNYLRDDRTSARPEAILDGGERRFFRSFLFGELRDDAGWRLRARLRAGYDFTGRFWLLRPDVTYRILSRPEIEIALTGEAIGAERTGTYSKASRYLPTPC